MTRAKYVAIQMVLLLVTLAALAANVGFGLATGSPISWAAAVFIAPLVVFQLVMAIKATGS